MWWNRADGRGDDVGYAIAGLLPIVVGAALVPLRDEIVPTNNALILVVVVVLGAVVGGRGPAAVAAVVATLSYDFFLTRPYLSLRIDDADDIETAVILLVIGVIVGQVLVVTRRARKHASRTSAEVQRLRRIAEHISAGDSDEDLLRIVGDELQGLLGLRRCRFERAPADPDLPHIDRNGALVGGHERWFDGEYLGLPDAETALPVLAGGVVVGSFILDPDPKVGVSVEERAVAVAMADLVGGALARSGGSRTPG